MNAPLPHNVHVPDTQFVLRPPRTEQDAARYRRSHITQFIGHIVIAQGTIEIFNNEYITSFKHPLIDYQIFPCSPYDLQPMHELLGRR